MDVECVADYRCTLGEGPVWHPDEHVLFWVDITAGRLFRYDPIRDAHACVHEADVISGLTMEHDGSLLLFMDGGRVGRWANGTLDAVTTVVDGEADTRFNDVIADPAGRVFCGTMPTDTRGGRLYRLDVDGTATRLADGIGIPNGMGFTRDRSEFYFTETEASAIYRYTYDETTGRLSERRPFVRTPDTPGLPDGMTVDADGCVWSARWNGGCVVRYDPTGNELTRVELPAQKATSVAFGGPDLDQLYVTSGGGDDRPAQGPRAGALFRLEPGVSGREEFRSDIDI